ncbi:HrgA protein [Haloferula helveola]|uniref:HrgA protein n=1 Tax=Haloferula helveola TaxID=490095 RepID=A0ABN6HBL1_9BACT|nr:HrgA protein [Haloferula helveola]
MSLRTQLSDLLPALLPQNPSEAIKGTELIRLVRLQLSGNYSDASLRYHFSIMSCDPASPIAKVEKGQGYYRRSAPVPALSGAQELLALSQGRLEDLNADRGAVDHALERVKKFRAIVRRFSEVNGRFPFEYRDAFTAGSPLGNLWKYPELVVVDWQTGEDSDEDMALESRMLSLKQRLGLPPFRLSATRLRIQASLHSFREDFFQTLSASMWTQGGELVYAAPIEDEALADGLRALNATFGVGVSSFGIGIETLDDLPRAANILNAHPKETEALMERINFDRIAAPRHRQHIDWGALEALRRESGETASLIDWVCDCIELGKASHYTPK